MDEKEKQTSVTPAEENNDEIIDKTADEILDKYLPAFIELAK